MNRRNGQQGKGQGPGGGPGQPPSGPPSGRQQERAGVEQGAGEPAGLAAELWRQNQDLAAGCLDHPFVQGIARGDLPRSKFIWYVGQDATYLESFARAYALAIAKAPDRETMVTFHRLLQGVLQELRLHHGYAARWGAVLHPEPSLATRAYTGFLLDVAWSRGVGAIAAAMTPCMRLYAFLGRSLLGRVAPGNPYREWVETYGSPDFAALAAQLEGVLNRWHGEAGGPAGVAPLYRTAMELERAFFDAAWHAG